MYFAPPRKDELRCILCYPLDRVSHHFKVRAVKKIDTSEQGPRDIAHEASGAITFGAARSPERLVLHGSVVMAVAGTIAPGKLLEVRHCITHGNRVRSH